MGKKPKGAYKEQWKDYPDITNAFKEAWEIPATEAEGYIDPYAAHEQRLSVQPGPRLSGSTTHGRVGHQSGTWTESRLVIGTQMTQLFF